MKKLIPILISIFFAISLLFSYVYFGEYSNTENNLETKYAAIPPVKLPPVPPKD